MKKLRSLNKNFIIGISSLFLFSALIAAYATFIKEDAISTHGQSKLGIRRISHDVSVSALIGEYRFTLTGFTSPGARVVFEGLGIFDETYADEDGQFSFLNRFSPFSPREACLTAYDTDGRISSPLCLPPFPVNKNVVIGPILLPPTVAISDSIFRVNDYGTISGKGAPESLVEVQLYPDTSAHKIALHTQTDTDGNYTLTVPSETRNSIRVFTTNLFRNLFSDKSNTLTIDILPLWLLIIRHLAGFFTLLKAYGIPLLLAAEALILAWFVFISGKRGLKHPLALRPDHELDERAQSVLVDESTDE